MREREFDFRFQTGLVPQVTPCGPDNYQQPTGGLLLVFQFSYGNIFKKSLLFIYWLTLVKPIVFRSYTPAGPYCLFAI